MKGFVAGAERAQASLLPECLEDWVDESNPVRVIDAFVDALDLADLGFDGVEPEATGRPSYHPSTHLKLYIYGYLYRVQSSRRLTDRMAIVELIGATTTKAGLKSSARSIHRTYQKGIKVSDAEMATLNITGDDFHPEWNYTIKPKWHRRA